MQPLQTYPVLRSGNEIHIHPGGGTLFTEAYLELLSREETRFLVGCDGSKTAAELMPAAWRAQHASLGFLKLIARLVNEGRITIAEAPRLTPLRVTGSETAYIPPHMSLELTAGCNLKCSHCYRQSEIGKNRYMPVEDFLRILRILSVSGLRSVELTGGEPFLHKDILRILDFCGENLRMIGILSNGTILTKPICERLAGFAERLVFSVSLDGSTPHTHDAIRGVVGSFVRTTRNIEVLSKLGIKVRVSMSVSEANFPDIERTILLARDLGAIAFSYTPVLPFGRAASVGLTGWRLDPVDVMNTEKNLAEKYRGFLTVFGEAMQKELEAGGNCGAGYRAYTMDPWGNVRPCPMYGVGEVVIGNLRDESVEKVFSHPLAGIFSDLVLPNADTCRGCRLERFCCYCSLRGFRASAVVKDCRWIKDPRVQAILPYIQSSDSNCVN